MQGKACSANLLRRRPARLPPAGLWMRTESDKRLRRLRDACIEKVAEASRSMKAMASYHITGLFREAIYKRIRGYPLS